MNRETKIRSAQKYLEEMGAGGWLLYDFHRSNGLAHLFLEIPPEKMVTRRFFYWIPTRGEPIKLVHAIEEGVLDGWPGRKETFLSWQSLEEKLRTLVQGAGKIAMEISPRNANPYISKVDAGTVDLLRSFGVEVVSSGDFLPHFTAVIDEEQAASHLRAAKWLDEIVRQTWDWIRERLLKGAPLTEYEVQQKILADFKQKGLVTDAPPIVAVNAHSADPHYEPREKSSSPIRKGDFLLIDLWAKEGTSARTIFADITRVAVLAPQPSHRQSEIFPIVRKAQKQATELVKSRFAARKRVEGWEVDEAARKIIRDAGYGEHFLHRTGHSIEVSLHGSGTHMDNFEIRDERPILPGTCFSIEPGIYLKGEFGVRLEYDIYVDPRGKVAVTGGIQDALACLSI